MGKHKKEKKKKDKKKKRDRDRSRSRSTSTDHSSQASRASSPHHTTKEEAFRHEESKSKNWALSEKSESLLYGSKTEREEPVTSNFVWKKKHEKVGIDRLDFDTMSELNARKQIEAKVSSIESLFAFVLVSFGKFLFNCRMNWRNSKRERSRGNEKMRNASESE
jgi:hypothetical protein